ncbi:MAG: efflux RND transporter permease subunit [Paludibacter sp.]|nr:efflux RND transporter permease subunit [Bacteroidales bacterium]MCM1069246.1 efflux RND transporter permease subunit [Prevotella sp.]MCM1354334.1 efflux RND transporter permease subunit [Bacteroides sp.]MCM1443206.1 efflux RND transporter permease subunit [Muribaculum sp.]MCM1481801.1 efflux RND transporter permease subunit [Paludibacter sp.]
MSIYRSAIEKPVTTILIFVAVMIVGIFCYVQLPIDQFPEMDPPYVTVLTTYPGASASEMETNVTKIVENSLTSVDHLKHITSQSKDNISMVTLEFEWGSDIDEAVNDIRSFVDMTKDNLPDNCGTPVIFKLSTSSMPIIQYSFTADETYPGLDKILNDEIIPQLNQVDGIGNISLSGSPERYVYVDIDQQKLDAYGLTLETVGNIVASNNLNLSSGTIKMPQEQYQMQVRSEYIESDEINNLVVTTTPDGRQVFVRDIATVKDTIKDLSLDEKTNGRESVRLIIAKQTGANAVQICRDVRKQMEKIQKTLPSDVQIETIYDSSENIQNSIDSLQESILYALLFVVLVVLFFLGKWRATIIIGITIPIALIVAFIYLKLAGSSLNIISLCSLTIAIGMVVDDAIVVLENITKHVERGESPREAAIYATNEVWVSVIATTLVLVAVFVPLTMLTGMAGIMFHELGWIVTIVCCTSTLVAITLTPMLSSKLLKSRKMHVDAEGNLIDEDAGKKSWYERTIVRMLDKVDDWYGRALAACLNHKAITLVVLLLLFVASLMPAFLGKIGTDFTQQQDNGRLTVTVKLQRGTRIEETLKTARALETRFEALVPEILIINTSAGSNDDASISAMFSSTMNNKISMTIRCSKKYERERSIFEIAEVLRQEMARYPEIIEYQCNTGSGMGGGESTVDIEIYGYDFDKTSQMAETVKRLASELPGARDANISREDDRPEIKITVDKEKASRNGLTSATISSYLRNRVNGMTAGYLKEDGNEYDIVVRLEEEDRNSISDVLDLTIPGVNGNVKLSEIASVGEYWAPPTIERKARQRIVTVKVTPYKTSLGELAAAIETNVLPQLDVPAGYVVRMAGDYEDQQDTFRDMIMLGVLIILLVYIVMASQFESFSMPGIIMFTIPFALSGVILALWITGVSLDMIGALGLVMLVGIVVKNGIVLVDYINLMRERGHELNEAIVMSGKSRIRPVLMTAFTTILGMVPMALSAGEGSEMWQPMGIVVIGGLTVSTFLTLFIVPVLYGAISRHGERDKQRKIREKFIFMDIKVKKDC